jgi:hypothetical protein
MVRLIIIEIIINNIFLQMLAMATVQQRCQGGETWEEPVAKLATRGGSSPYILWARQWRKGEPQVEEAQESPSRDQSRLRHWEERTRHTNANSCAQMLLVLPNCLQLQLLFYFIECKVKPSTCYDEYKYQLQVLLVLLCTRHYRGMLALLPYTAMHQALETTTGIEDDGWGTLQQWIVHATMHAQDEIPPRKLNNLFKLLKKTKERPECVDRYLGRLVSCIKQNLLYMERQDSAAGALCSWVINMWTRTHMSSTIERIHFRAKSSMSSPPQVLSG